MIRVGVIGASGLAGGELIRLITQHPGLELTFLGGSGSVGRRVTELHPGLRGAVDAALTVEPVTDADAVAHRCDVSLLATPAPESARLAGVLADRVECVVDLSGAFRIRDGEAHRKWYPKVERPPALAERFIYGVPELVGDQMKGAALISLPGCYATAITLALAPLVLGLKLELTRVLVDGKSGSSGGGLTGRTSDLHPLRDGAIAPYAPVGHRHGAEVTDFFSRAKPGAVGSVAMSAYGVSQVRGLLASCYAFTDAEVDETALRRAYLRFHRHHRFVRVRQPAETVIALPDPKAVAGSNLCDVAVAYDADGGRIVALAALDNLVKGAAGQAVQAVNLRFGLGEDTGLTMLPVVPS